MGDQTHSLHWLASAGGPLLLLSSEYLNAWLGYNLEDVVEDAEDAAEAWLSGQTDYDHACAAEDYLGLVPVNGGQALVLGGEPLSTAWWQAPLTEGILVRWEYGEDYATAEGSLAHLEEGIWKPSGITFEVGTHPLHLFDAAWPGGEVSEQLVVRLNEGRDEVDTAIARPGQKTELLLHRFRRP
jgi:Immunity protein 21